MARAIFGATTRTSNPNPSGIRQGSPGGLPQAGGKLRNLAMGDEVYLWILVIVEVAIMGFLRRHFRRYHGG